MVVSVGVDASKDKHDCFILSSEGEVLADVFTIPPLLLHSRLCRDKRRKKSSATISCTSRSA